MDTMNALVWKGDGALSLERRPIPALQGPRDAIVRVTRSTICTSDLHIRSGAVPRARPGVVLGQKVTPIERVGLYVPGGTASYPSSVLMNAIPARLAGVSEIIMVTPPAKDGSVAPAILTAARVAGVTAIYKMGGAQAVAALAYGTESVPKVDKIVGPGNIFVAAAKRRVYGIVDIDMIAGPSEILVLADAAANPAT